MSDSVSDAKEVAGSAFAQDATSEIRNEEGFVLFVHHGPTLRGAFLGNAYLRRAKLCGTDLRGVDLSDADLRDCDLSGVNLEGANLTDTDFSGAKLPWSNLRGAQLKGTKFDGADLAHVDFAEAKIEHSTPPSFQSAILHCANLANLEFYKATFACADLRRANLNNAGLAACDFTGADLRAASLVETNMHAVRLDDACLYRVDFSKVNNLSTQGGVKRSPFFDASTKWPPFSLARFTALSLSQELWAPAIVGIAILFPFLIIGFLISLFTGHLPSWIRYPFWLGATVAAASCVVRISNLFCRSCTREGEGLFFQMVSDLKMVVIGMSVAAEGTSVCKDRDCPRIKSASS